MFDPSKFKAGPIYPPHVNGPIVDGKSPSRFTEWSKTPVEGVFVSFAINDGEGIFTARASELAWYPEWTRKEFISFYKRNGCFPEGEYFVMDDGIKHLYVQMHRISREYYSA